MEAASGPRTARADTSRTDEPPQDHAMRLAPDWMRSGRVLLCATTAPAWPPAQDLHGLLGMVGREGVGDIPRTEPSHWAHELKWRVERGSALPLLRHMAERMADDAANAALASHGGAMAAILADRRAQRWTTTAKCLEAAHHRVGGWLHSLGAGFKNGAEDDGWPARATPVRSVLLNARAALNCIGHDLVRCVVHLAIEEGALPPESAVLGTLAVLRDLKPAALADADGHANADAFSGLARLAVDLTAQVQAFATGLSPVRAVLLRSLAPQGVDAQTLISRVADAIARFAGDCPDARARATLARLLDALRDAGAAFPPQGTRRAPHVNAAGGPLLPPPAEFLQRHWPLGA